MIDPIENDTHSRVLELLTRGQADQDTLGAHLSPEDRAARGELRAWTPKDHVAHNNFWRRDAVQRLRAALEGSAPPDTEQDDAQTLLINDRVFSEQRETSWERLVAETAVLRGETASLIQRIAAEDLTERDRYPWQRGGSLKGLIFVNWYDHPAEHWTDIYLSRGDLDHALDLRQVVVATAAELFPDDRKLFSYIAYKLGALYARNGRSDDAIRSIGEALAANAALVDWARDDSDLEALRALPAFQAVYMNAKLPTRHP